MTDNITASHPKPETVTIYIPSGYKDADEFLRDCQFERAVITYPTKSVGMKTVADDCRVAAKTWREEMSRSASCGPESVAAIYERVATSIESALMSARAQPAGLREALQDTRKAIAGLAEYALGGVEVEHTDGSGVAYQYPIRDELLAKIDAALASQPSPAATVETELWATLDERPSVPVDTKSAPGQRASHNSGERRSSSDAAGLGADTQCSAASEGARLSNWLADYSHDLKEEGDFDQEAAQLDKASQWIAGHLNVLPQAVPVLPPTREIQKLIEDFIAPDLDTEKAFAPHRRSWVVQCLQAALSLTRPQSGSGK